MRERRCIFCNKLFEPTRKDNVFCSPECQQINYRRFGPIRFPKKRWTVFKCPKCGIKQVLDFNPLKDSEKWFKVACVCGYRVIGG